ncbi:hypothetical protein RM780_26415 [Streptomyces sp. DSM 44917]|uniref:Translation initiation factor 2 n=1 Tax=Streptomyces boetiae TaxID=3075541 RepID=A0ABU2LG75_9ACTN|nr:hypothetical protein [Streptomyces sp. DSM 44917]MDT0310455.1 hypothetical protein [Streptomyces sp. DSM 44917]
MTSSTRLLEVLPALFGDDPRVEVLFGYDSTSAFNGGVLDLLGAHDVRVVGWEDAGEGPCDLVLTATENASFGHLRAPVLVMPHGVGFHKMVPDARGPGRRLSGVVPAALLESERSWYAVSHPDQAEQLGAVRPDLAGRTLLVGDPCYDQLLDSRAARTRYRRALGLEEGDGRRLAVVSSTWGRQSLIGTVPDLPRRLLAELPLDDYAVAAILHPNVWFGHSPWQIRTLQRGALEAGLLLIPPFAGWQAAVVAADVVLGDHGSVTLYAAALGRPVLLAAFGEESVPGTAMDALGRGATALDPAKGLREQIENERARHRPEVAEELAGLAFRHPGMALARLRSAVYGLLDLAQPPAPVRRPPAFADPAPQRHRDTAQVIGSVLLQEAGAWVIEVRRFPAAARPGREESDRSFSHLVSDLADGGRAWAESASVVTRGDPASSAEESERRVAEIRHGYPGCALAAARLPDGGVLLLTRDGRTVRAAGKGGPDDPAVLSAVAYVCLRAGLPMAGTFGVRLGGRALEVTLSPWPAP